MNSTTSLGAQIAATSGYLPVQVDAALYPAMARLLSVSTGTASDALHWPSAMRRITHLVANKPAAISREDAELLRSAAENRHPRKADAMCRASFFAQRRTALAAVTRMLGGAA